MVDESAYSFGRWCVVDSGHNPAKMRRAERGKILLQITEQLKFPTLWMRFPTFLVGNLFQRVGNLFVVPL
jgi:hypothetical protein